MVYLAIDLDTIVADGLVGLAPNSPNDHPNPTLVTTLYNNGVIDRNMFSLYLAKTDQDSKIWFGGFDPEYIRSAIDGGQLMTYEELESQIAWQPISSSFYWSTAI
jgi:hypothetical protein